MPKQTMYLLTFFLLTGIVEAIWGMGQLYGFLPSFNNSFKITGSFYNPGPFSGYIAVVVPLALYFLVKDIPTVKERRGFHFLRWCISLLTISLSAVILPATLSRASWLAVIIGCLFVLISSVYGSNIWISFCKFRNESIFRRILIPTLFSVLLFSSVIGVYYLKKDSADGRILIWKNTIQVMKENPFGVGLGYFPGYYGNSQIDYFSKGQATDREIFLAGRPDYAFNEYLQVGAETGIVGLILFIAVLFTGIYQSLRLKAYGTTGSFIALMVFAFVSYPFSLLPFLIVFVFLLAQCNGHYGMTKIYFTNTFIILAICAVCSFSTLYDQYPSYEAYKKWFIAQHLYKSKAYEKSLELYENVKQHLSDNPSFLFEYANCLTANKQHEKSNAALKRAYNFCCDPVVFIRMGANYQSMKDFNRAIYCYQKAGYLIPNRLYPYYLLTKAYLNIGDYKKAIQTAQYCLSKPVKIQSQATEEIRKEMRSILNLYGDE